MSLITYKRVLVNILFSSPVFKAKSRKILAKLAVVSRESCRLAINILCKVLIRRAWSCGVSSFVSLGCLQRSKNKWYKVKIDSLSSNSIAFPNSLIISIEAKMHVILERKSSLLFSKCLRWYSLNKSPQLPRLSIRSEMISALIRCTNLNKVSKALIRIQ